MFWLRMRTTHCYTQLRATQNTKEWKSVNKITVELHTSSQAMANELQQHRRNKKNQHRINFFYLLLFNGASKHTIQQKRKKYTISFSQSLIECVEHSFSLHTELSNLHIQRIVFFSSNALKQTVLTLVQICTQKMRPKLTFFLNFLCWLSANVLS